LRKRMAAQMLAAALPQLLSPDAATRQAGENALEALKGQPETYLPALANAAGTLEQTELKQMAMIVLKRGSTAPVWNATPPAGQEEVKDRLLSLLSVAQPSTRVLTTLTSTIAAVAQCVSDTEGKWDSLLPSTFTSLTSQDEGVRLAGLSLLADLAYQLPPEALEAFLPHLGPLFAQAMASAHLRVQAVRTAAALVTQQVAVKGGEKKIEGLSALVPTFLEVLSSCVSSGDQAGARDVVSCLIDMVGEYPNLIRTTVQPVLTAMLSLARNGSLDEGIRYTAIELLTTYAEAKPVQFRKCTGALDGTLQALFECMDRVEEDDEWVGNEADREEEDEEQDEVEMAESALQRVILAAGGSKTAGPVLALAEQRMSSAKWQHRYSALRALGILAGAAGDSLQDQNASILSALLTCAADPNPRVAWACLGALAAILSSYGPDVQSEHHASIMPVLAHLMQPTTHPRLRSRATRCIVDFMAECSEEEAEMVDGYATGIIGVLTEMVVSGSPAHKLCAVSAISATAVALQERFSRFYSALMPGFVAMLSQTDLRDRDSRELRGKAMECVSFIADAVGPEVFGQDAPAVMELLMAGHKGSIEADDPQVPYLLQASARIAKCMKSDFAPYMAHLLPPVLAFARLDPKLDLQAADAEGEGEGGESAVVDIKGMGKMKVSINIKELEDKALGCTVLAALAESLQEHFMPFLEVSAEILLPCVCYKLSDDVRVASVEAMPDLIRALKAAVDKGMQAPAALYALWEKAWIQLMQAAICEPEAEGQTTILSAVSQCIEICGAGCLSDEQQLQLCTVVQPVVQDHIDGASKEEDDDEDEEDEREEVLREVVEVLCAALKAHGASFVPKVQSTVLPLFGQLLGDQRSSDDKCAALNVLVDLVDHGGDAAVHLSSNVAAACLQHSSHPHPHVRRSACYGLAVCAQRGGATFAPLVPSALQTMHGIVMAQGSREGDNAAATDNAVDAVGRMCRYQAQSGIDAASVLPTWVTWLPLRHDDECAAEAHSYLAELLETGSPHIVGCLPDALRVVCAVRGGLGLEAGQSMGDDALKDRLGRALAGVPGDALAAARGRVDASLLAHL